jgi:hypothetical protein
MRPRRLRHGYHNAMKVLLEELTPAGTQRTEALEVVGRDEPNGLTAAAMLQLAKYLYQEFGEPRGLYIAGRPNCLLQHSFGDGHLVVVRQATVQEAQAHTFRPLPRVALPFQIHIPARILQTAEQDAVLLLRLGAVGNALQTVLQGSTTGDRDGTVRKRDLIHRTLIVASFVQELDKIVHGDKSHSGRFWELARLGATARFGIPVEVINEFQELMNPKGPLMKRMKDLRDFVGFHLLPREFRSWLRKRDPEEKLMVHSEPDPARNDVVFVASAAAVADAYNDDDATAFLFAANRLAWTLPAVIAAGTYGLLISQGHDPGRFIAIDAKAALTGVRTKRDTDSENSSAEP